MVDPAPEPLFSTDVAQLYQRLLVPLIFEDYAADLARRLAALAPRTVLEVAAGTGVVTRALARTLPEDVEITATDLSPAMIDQATALGTARPVRWEQADVTALPYAHAAFDAVGCQFGVMFFPAKRDAFAEVRRVLRPGGRFVFSVWDRIETNEFAHVVTDAVATLFPDDPPRFLPRTPYGYHDADVITADLRAGGFDASIRIEPMAVPSRAPTAQAVAVGFCQGTLLRDEIEQRDPGRLAEATSVAAEAVARRFGSVDPVASIRAWVVTAD